MDEIRLLISVASCRDWKADFGLSYMHMWHYLLRNRLDGRLTVLDSSISPSGGNICQVREDAFQLAVDGNFTHWLSLDDDMVFPHDCVDRLVSREKDVVTANYARKVPGVVEGVCLGLNGERLSSVGKSGLEKILGMGMGMSLVKIEKVKNIPAPHFELRWNPTMKRYWGEDYNFSMILQENGIDVWCDHDLSQDMIHIGNFPFGFPQIPAELQRKAA